MGTTALTAPPDKARLWAPRLLAAAVSLFLAIFSLDAFGGATTFGEALPDFLIHLIPAAIVLAVVALAWHREWIGAVTFFTDGGWRMPWRLAHIRRGSPSISGPLLMVAALYALELDAPEDRR